jgi:hypothetical protein
MFQIKSLAELSPEELSAEWARACEYTDQLTILLGTLKMACTALQALLVYYSGFKQQELFLQGMEQVVGSCQQRMRVVSARGLTMVDYTDEIERLFGAEPELRDGWDAFEQVASELEVQAFAFKEKDQPTKRNGKAN